MAEAVRRCCTCDNTTYFLRVAKRNQINKAVAYGSKPLDGIVKLLRSPIMLDAEANLADLSIRICQARL